jgi:hypothetical protein
MSSSIVDAPSTAGAIELKSTAPLAFLYEHPQWFNPIFQELDRRAVAYTKIHAPEHFYSAGEPFGRPARARHRNLPYIGVAWTA